MSPIGISILKSRDVDSSIMEAVVAMKIVLQRKANARVDAVEEKKSDREFSRQGEIPSHQLKLQDKRADLTLADKRIIACFHIHLEIVVNNTEGIIMTEAMEFVASSFTRDAMETKIISKRLRNARAFVMMLLACAILLPYKDVVLKISPNGTTMPIAKNVKNSSIAVATETKTTLMINAHARMPADIERTTGVHQKLTIQLHQSHAL